VVPSLYELAQKVLDSAAILNRAAEVTQLNTFTADRPPILILLAILLLGTPSAAGAAVIDFETLTELTPITTQFAGLTLTNATVLTAGSILNEFDFPPRSGVNVAVDDGGPITITFDVPQASVGGFFTYVAPLTMTAFDAASTPIGGDLSDFGTNAALSGDVGSTPNELLEVASSLGIVRVTIAGNASGDSFTLDDLTFVALPRISASGPAPAGLLGVGLILAGAFQVGRRVCGRRPAS
jgi:hypothetical protein